MSAQSLSQHFFPANKLSPQVGYTSRCLPPGPMVFPIRPQPIILGGFPLLWNIPFFWSSFLFFAYIPLPRICLCRTCHQPNAVPFFHLQRDQALVMFEWLLAPGWDTILSPSFDLEFVSRVNALWSVSAPPIHVRLFLEPPDRCFSELDIWEPQSFAIPKLGTATPPLSLILSKLPSILQVCGVRLSSFKLHFQNDLVGFPKVGSLAKHIFPETLPHCAWIPMNLSLRCLCSQIPT